MSSVKFMVNGKGPCEKGFGPYPQPLTPLSALVEMPLTYQHPQTQPSGAREQGSCSSAMLCWASPLCKEVPEKLQP